MFFKILFFELRYWLRQPMMYIFLFINALLIFGATSSESVTVGGSIGNVHKNAPYVVENFYAVISLISLLMVTAFLNVAAARDFTYNTSQIIFTTPLSKFGFLMGRFWGATAIAIVPFLGVSIGNILGAAMPWLDPERVGVTYLTAHLTGLYVFIIPNVIFCGAFIFAIATLTRSTIYSFIGTILLLVGYGIANGLIRDLRNEYLGTLIDPFGIRTFSIATKYWTVEDKNTMSLGLTGIMLVKPERTCFHIPTGFKNRLHSAIQSFKGSYRTISVMLFVLWVATAGFVFYNTKIENHFNTPHTTERLTSEYEKKYKKFENTNQPRLQ
jgi:hypothetical protein